MRVKIVVAVIAAALFTSCGLFDDENYKVIKNIEQFLRIPDNSSFSYALGADLDFSGVTVQPKRFCGKLDGNGHVISNLTITSSEDCVGLFSTCSGTVSNLTVRNVNINAPQSSNVGTLSGTGGTFNNCKVILGEASSITGGSHVGGISGSEAKLTGCSVESMSENPVVRGNSMVGGLVGWCYSGIESCVVNAIVVGAEDVGGIVGSGRTSIKCCSFQGKVEGESRIGGIIGAYESWHTGSLMHGCKVDADVIAKESSAGGLIGYTYDDELKVIGCYAKGTVNAPTSCGGLLGGRYGHCDCYLCYAVMDSSSDSFDGLGCARHIDCATVHPAHGSIYGTNVKYECTDVTTFLRECYSDYTDYWNFADTWLYDSTVSCPKLAWESSFDQSQQDDTNPWNGSKATSFAGGTGAMWDPYIIKTGGQLLLAKDHSDKYFELGGNIDLNGKNWLPFVFRGTLDGKGYSISNLYINRIDDSQGLFSTCSGTVSNLTVRNVNINAPQSSYVGTLSGTGGTFNNCKVVLGEASSITGNNYVGGISGSEAKFTGCSVESMSENPVVRGNSMVGGLVGWCYSGIESCVVNAIVVGAEDVGGIVGSGRTSIKCCSFQGKVEGESRIGGIIGAYESWHTGSLMHGCKVDADVIAKESSAGGLIGYTYDDELKVIGCYAKGTVNAPTSCGGLLGGRYGHCDCYLCYAVMDSSSDSFDGLGCAGHIDCATVHPAHGSIYGTNVKYECTDITTFLQDCYSDYASYWNYNNTWTWKGTINGKEVSVSCPRLAWEQ